MRCRQELSGPWSFQPDPWGEGDSRSYFAPGFDDRLWRQAAVPCAMDACLPRQDFYEGQGWYRHVFRPPADWQGRRVVLRFEGVNYRARVWLNGEHLGNHCDGFLPFQFPVHSRLRFGQDNVLVVHTDNSRWQGEVPGIQAGWRNWGGILREVVLLSSPTRWIDDVHIVAEPVADGGKLHAEVLLASEQSPAVDVQLSIEILDTAGKSLAKLDSPPTSLKADGSTTVNLGGLAPGAAAWSPDMPVLYIARATLGSGGQVLDSVDVRFGFRRIERRGTQLLLNGRPLYLTGFNRHEDSPRTDMCPDLGLVRRDILMMKQAGANFVRLCHYPHHPGELDLLDELGLLAMDEIPLWQWDTKKEEPQHNVNKLTAAKRQLEAMIARDRNHPCLIFWSVSNETYEEQPEIRAGNEELIRQARQLDPSRLAVHVSSYFWADHAFDADDVICFNGYPNIPVWAVKPGAKRDPLKPGDYFRDMVEQLHARYPDKPIMITEFGHPRFEGVRDCQFGEDKQAQAIEHAFTGMDAPWCCGATIWCFADHGYPTGSLGFYAITMATFGAITRDRQPLAAYEAARKVFAERQRARAAPAAEKPGKPA